LFYTLESRWADNDIYGQINTVAYYAYFDTVVNRFLIEEGAMRPGTDEVVGYVVQSSANYFTPVSYPTTLSIGLRVERLGTKSVTWSLGVFALDAHQSCVTGQFTHAFVERTSGLSAEIPLSIRSAIDALDSPVGSG
jgi:acyl-CoA thioester hydrolase